jgi:hypothetical protein
MNKITYSVADSRDYAHAQFRIEFFKHVNRVSVYWEVWNLNLNNGFVFDKVICDIGLNLYSFTAFMVPSIYNIESEAAFLLELKLAKGAIYGEIEIP